MGGRLFEETVRISTAAVLIIAEIEMKFSVKLELLRRKPPKCFFKLLPEILPEEVKESR
jgi:hypothetical protein